MALAHLEAVAGRVIHNVGDNMAWDKFRAMVIQTTQPSLRTVVALTQLQKVTYKDNFDSVLEEIRKQAVQAYPCSTLVGLQQHTLATLLRILPKTVEDHFTLHDPVGFDQDNCNLRRILIFQTSTTNSVNNIKRQTSPSPHGTLRWKQGKSRNPRPDSPTPLWYQQLSPFSYTACSSQCSVHQMRDALCGLRRRKPQGRIRTVDTNDEEPSAGETNAETKGEEMEEDEPDFPIRS